VAHFLAQHLVIQVNDLLAKINNFVQLVPWTLAFDGSRMQLAVGARIIITNPDGRRSCFIHQLSPTCSNNQAEYEVLIAGLKLLLE